MYKVMGGGAWTSAMFKVMEGARSVSHVQGNERGGMRSLSHVQSDGRG